MGRKLKPYSRFYPFLRILNGTHRAVPVQDHFHQIEPQSAAAGAPVPGTLLPVKGFKQVGQGISADPRSGVLHTQGGAALQPAAPNPDFRPLRRVAGGVGEQVAHGLPQQGGVCRAR